MAGQLRYLDDRLDEQRRGITMKSSAVALYHRGKTEEHLVNLIDSPGHIDFRTEVLSAARISDGAVIIVDVVEGVCAQTLSSIEIAYREKLRMLLVLNKIDRLFIERRMSAGEAHLRLMQVLENVNAVVAEIRLRDYTLRVEEADAEQMDDEFRPEARNVVFASAVDGWGFRLREFAELYAGQLRLGVDSLERNLWSDAYYNRKTNELVNGARLKGKKPAFETFVLGNLAALYESIVTRRDPDKIAKIVERLKIKIGRDTSSNVPRTQLRAVASEWLPLSEALMSSITEIVPPPTALPVERIDRILRRDELNDAEKAVVSKIAPSVASCDANAPTVAYVSKFMTVDRAKLPRNHQTTQVDIAERRRIIQKMRLDMRRKLETDRPDEAQPEARPESTKSSIEFVACVRIFTGVVRAGMQLFVVCPDAIETALTVTGMYLLLGRDIVPITEAVAGNVVGLANVSKSLLKSGTVSSTNDCVPIIENDVVVEPFYRTAITPTRAADLPGMKDAIKLLLQSDSCVQCVEQEDGQLVLLTAGDVHLEKCREDLSRYTDVPFDVSKPMVRLRETVHVEKDGSSKAARLEVPNVFRLELYATSMPGEIERLVSEHFSALKAIELSEDDRRYRRIEEKIRREFDSLLAASHPGFTGANRINVGNNRLDACLLVNLAPNHALYNRMLLNSFQLSTQSGPFCGEPVKNVMFFVTAFEIAPGSAIPASIGEIKELFRKSMSNRTPRLMEPFYRTTLNVEASIVGKLSKSLYRRNGRIVSSGQFAPGIFAVDAVLPVVDSFNFSNEIRTDTGGKANPFLEFSHYEVIDQNPFDVILDEEETELENRASRLMNDVRRRKGLHVDEKIVAFAEKQRTLNRKK